MTPTRCCLLSGVERSLRGRGSSYPQDGDGLRGLLRARFTRPQPGDNSATDRFPAENFSVSRRPELAVALGLRGPKGDCTIAERGRR
jgi:hypothetical protein